MQRAFLWTMIFSLAAAAALAIVAVLVEDLGSTGTDILITSLLVGGFSMVCLACAYVLGRRRIVPAMWVGIGSSLAALAIWIVSIWFNTWNWASPWDEYMLKLGATFTTMCLWSGHVGLLSLPPLNHKGWRRVRTATISIATVLACLIVFVFWTEFDEDAMWKLIAVLSILSACGTVVTPILALIERLRHRAADAEGAVLARAIAVSLTCPRCRADQTVQTGKANCSACGLQIEIRVEEPRCHCGYLLYDLTGNKCPECGRAIDDSNRWASSETSR